jgi:hypothetical protein
VWWHVTNQRSDRTRKLTTNTKDIICVVTCHKPKKFTTNTKDIICVVTCHKPKKFATTTKALKWTLSHFGSNWLWSANHSLATASYCLLLAAILVAHRYGYFLLLFVVPCLPLWLLLANILVAYDFRLWLLLTSYRCDCWLLLTAMVVGCSLALWLLFIARH